MVPVSRVVGHRGCLVGRQEYSLECYCHRLTHAGCPDGHDGVQTPANPARSPAGCLTRRLVLVDRAEPGPGSGDLEENSRVQLGPPGWTVMERALSRL